MEGAQNFYYALCLNPKNEQIWSYFRQSILQADRFDLIDKTNERNVLALSNDFKKIEVGTLP